MAAVEETPADSSTGIAASAIESDTVKGWKTEEKVAALRNAVQSFQSSHSAEEAGWAWPAWAGAGAWPTRDLQRFLVARQGDVDKALRILTRHVQWRVQDCAYFPSGLPALKPVASALHSGKVHVAGRTKQGHPIAWVRAQQHIVADTTPEQSEQLVSFVVEQLVRAACTPPQPAELHAGADTPQQLPGQFVAVVDMAEYGYANLDTGIVKALLATISRNFPERMHKIYILNEGWVFWLIWKVIEGLLDERMKSKILFLGTEFKEVLQRDIPAHVLPEEYGGQRKGGFDLAAWTTQYNAAQVAARKQGANTTFTLPLPRDIQPVEEVLARDDA